LEGTIQQDWRVASTKIREESSVMALTGSPLGGRGSEIAVADTPPMLGISREKDSVNGVGDIRKEPEQNIEGIRALETEYIVSEVDGEDPNPGGESHESVTSHPTRDGLGGRQWTPEQKQERDEFYANLNRFMTSMGQPIQRLPTLGFKELDLWRLYKEVTSKDGIDAVIAKKQWKDIADALNLPPSCTDAGFRLRVHYNRYLESYERVNFLPPSTKDKGPEVPIQGTTKPKVTSPPQGMKSEDGAARKLALMSSPVLGGGKFT